MSKITYFYGYASIYNNMIVAMATGVAYEASGYKQAVQTEGRADGQADGPNRAKISRAILAEDWIIALK